MRAITEMLSEEKAQSDFGAVYLIIVFIIAALLLITVVKPMFKQSQQMVASKVPSSIANVQPATSS